ncbi:hypothetical protein, partial [Flavobacterium sp.]|uniref:hypothetical protein n=1 Tax=Flavobacterium sp. TaxID=239 RepID=UPI003264B02B
AFRHHADANRSAAWKLAREEQLLEIARQRTIRQEEHRLTRSNPLFSVLVIGLALLAGGITTLTLGDGEFDVTTIVAGLAVALAVLALGMLVNGLRGKRPGGASALAWLIVLPLVFFTLWPQNDHYQYTAAYFAPTQRPTGKPDVYAALTGPVVLDLEDYYENSDAGSESSDNIYLLVGSADVVVILPDNHVSVETVAGLGSVQVRHGDDDYEDWSKNSLITFDGDDSLSGRRLTVHIYGANGTITINDPEASK